MDEATNVLDLDLALPGRGQFRTVAAVGWTHLLELFGAIRRASDAGASATDGLSSTAMAEELAAIAARSIAAERDQRLLVPRTRLTSLGIVRACERHATAHLHQGVGLAELCEASGASERRVRHAFYECYGMSPTAYLRVVALHQVHHALLNGPHVPDPVTRAATGSGFWHLGRFAAQYRALFGESPSATVERRSQTTSTTGAESERPAGGLAECG